MDSNDARRLIMGLLIRCPFDVNAYGCCLQELRGGALNDSMEIVRGLSDAEVLHILDEHKKCLFQKEFG